MKPEIDLLYLSPHLDDAVLSCGGAIHRQTGHGKRVAVLTVCAGAAPTGPLSAYARALHARWEQSAHAPNADIVTIRKAEDAAALAALRADPEYLNLADCVYRRDASTGDWLYESDAAIFSELRTGDMGHIDEVAAALASLPGLTGHTRMVAPLGVGRHVDHQLTRRAAEAWAGRTGIDLLYYEDYPYAEREGRLYEVLQPSESWEPAPVELSAANLTAKVDAISRYASQLSTFWPDPAAMSQAVHDYAWRRGSFDVLAERYWRRA